MTTLIIGYGNPGRSDDGIGPLLAEKIEEKRLPGVSVETAFQPNIEDAAEIALHQTVIFIDAAQSGLEPFALRRLEPTQSMAFSSHIVSLNTILAICRDSFGHTLDAFLLAVRGYEFVFGENLTRTAEDNLEKALSFAVSFISYREKGKKMSGEEEKTILIIDDDSDILSTIRIVLESAGYAVGSAQSAEEGLTTAEKIKPDAIIVDLMMETIDAGAKLSQALKESGFKGPIYLLSSAGDVVRLNLDVRELGLAGTFQKPLDPKVLLNTLEKELRST